MPEGELALAAEDVGAEDTAVVGERGHGFDPSFSYYGRRGTWLLASTKSLNH